MCNIRLDKTNEELAKLLGPLGDVSIDTIDDLIAKHGIFPADYVKFIRKGEYPELDTMYYKGGKFEWNVSQIYCPVMTDWNISIRQEICGEHDWIPIAGDGCGNDFCFKIIDGCMQKAVFFRQKHNDNAIAIAGSFESFIKGLRKDMEDEIPPHVMESLEELHKYQWNH